jgi:hypothetical protein
MILKSEAMAKYSKKAGRKVEKGYERNETRKTS